MKCPRKKSLQLVDFGRVYISKTGLLTSMTNSHSNYFHKMKSRKIGKIKKKSRKISSRSNLVRPGSTADSFPPILPHSRRIFSQRSRGKQDEVRDEENQRLCWADCIPLPCCLSSCGQCSTFEPTYCCVWKDLRGLVIFKHTFNLLCSKYWNLTLTSLHLRSLTWSTSSSQYRR